MNCHEIHLVVLNRHPHNHLGDLATSGENTTLGIKIPNLFYRGII